MVIERGKKNRSCLVDLETGKEFDGHIRRLWVCIGYYNVSGFLLFVSRFVFVFVGVVWAAFLSRFLFRVFLSFLFWFSV